MDDAVADFVAAGHPPPVGIGRGEELFDSLVDAAHALRTVLVLPAGGMRVPAVLATIGHPGRARLAYAQGLFAAGSRRLVWNMIGGGPGDEKRFRGSPLPLYRAVNRRARERTCVAAVQIVQQVGVIEGATEGSAGAGYEVIGTTPEGWRGFCIAAREVLAGPGVGGAAEAGKEHAPGTQRGGTRG